MTETLITKNHANTRALITAVFEPTRFAPLDCFAAFSATGDDAAAFLQGQLTNDIHALTKGNFQRTGYCTAQGRLLASMLQWQGESQSFLHIISEDLLQTTLKRLKMFVLRSKVVLSDSMPTLAIAGLWGHLMDTSLAPGSMVKLHSGSTDHAGYLLIESSCPVLGDRAWLITPRESMPYWHQSLGATVATISPQAWMFSEINNAKAWITATTREAFVPQMINFELTDGVSFTKGCYPGQEVVARSQYLGKLKRRTFRADLAAGSESLQTFYGADIWVGENATEPCGRVVNAAPAFDAQGQKLPSICLLAEMPMDAWNAGNLHLQTPDGPALIGRSLPYEFIDVSDRSAH